MATRHDLPTDGAWVELRDVDDIRRADRRAVKGMSSRGIEMTAEGTVAAMDTVQIARNRDDLIDTIAARMVLTWHLPYAPDLLATFDGVGELKDADYERLRELTEPHLAVIDHRKAADDVDDHADPSSPSGPASA